MTPSKHSVRIAIIALLAALGTACAPAPTRPAAVTPVYVAPYTGWCGPGLWDPYWNTYCFGPAFYGYGLGYGAVYRTGYFGRSYGVPVVPAPVVTRPPRPVGPPPYRHFRSSPGWRGGHRHR